MPTGAGAPITSSGFASASLVESIAFGLRPSRRLAALDVMRPYVAGDWFAIPLRFRLFALGRAAAVDAGGAILGYFFARFYERLPSASDILGLTPGDAEIIGVCDQHGLSSGEWPVIATAHACDPRPWAIPIFRTVVPETGDLRWSTFDPTNLMHEIVFPTEPPDAGARNWGLLMPALTAVPMSWEGVEFALWRHFRVFQNGQHRKYIAALQRELTGVEAGRRGAETLGVPRPIIG